MIRGIFIKRPLLSAFAPSSRHDWLAFGVKRAPTVVAIALVIFIAHQLSILTWLAVPGSMVQGPLPAVTPRTTTQPAVDGTTAWATIAQQHLFGKAVIAPEDAQATPIEAPETTLRLTLTGVIARADPVTGLAIITSGATAQHQYAVGDAIKAARDTTLHAVYADRVILKRDGHLETLRLPQQSSGNDLVAQAPPREDPNPTVPQPVSAQQPPTNAARLTRMIRAVPQLRGGKMIGFRINPGTDSKAFTALGLKPGDIVTEINGTRLEDPGNVLQVFRSLDESSQAHVTLLRDGKSEVLILDTSKLQGLENHRQ